jgi:hypothetical protein
MGGNIARGIIFIRGNKKMSERFKPMIVGKPMVCGMCGFDMPKESVGYWDNYHKKATGKPTIVCSQECPSLAEYDEEPVAAPKEKTGKYTSDVKEIKSLLKSQDKELKSLIASEIKRITGICDGTEATQNTGSIHLRFYALIREFDEALGTLSTNLGTDTKLLEDKRMATLLLLEKYRVRVGLMLKMYKNCFHETEVSDTSD